MLRPRRPTRAAATLLAAAATLALQASPAAARPADVRACGAYAGSAAPGEVLVRYAAATTPRQVRLSAARAGARAVAPRVAGTRFRRLRLRRGETVQAALCRLARDGRVVSAQPNRVVRVASTAAPTDPYYASLWAMPKISAPAAWAVTTGSPAIVVADVDTGVNASVGDLAPNIWTNPGETGRDASGRDRATNGIDDDGNGRADDVHGWNFIAGNAATADDHGHGTHTSGTIDARGDDAFGVAGVAWRSSLMPVKVLAASGSGSEWGIASGFEYAARSGARVASASLGGSGWSQLTADVVLAHPETLFVFAAGNSALNVDASPVFPCTIKAANTICVAATDRNDALAGFSNYGATKVDLAAPGTGILSWWNGGLSAADGTSMATPHVAGAAALLFAKNPDATPAQVKAALLGGVDPVPGLVGRVATGGRLNVKRALDLLPAPGPKAPVPSIDVPAATSATAATLAGSVDPAGAATSWWFEYGTTSALGSRVGTGSLAAGAGRSAVTASLTGLVANTTYSVRLVAQNAVGTAASPIVTLTTPASPPTIGAASAGSIGWSGATIAATATTPGAAGRAWVELGPTAAYGTASPAVALAAVRTPQALELPVAGLLPGTLYHYRVVADNGTGGPQAGVDRTFTTRAQAAPALGQPAVQAAATAATLRVDVELEGLPAQGVLELGTSTAYDGAPVVRRLPATAGPVPTTWRVEGLLPATVYHARLTVATRAGSTTTADVAFATTAAPGGTAAAEGAPQAAGDAAQLPVAAVAGAQLDPIAIVPDGPGAAVVTAWSRTAGALVGADFGADATYGATAAPVQAGPVTPALVAVRLTGLPAGASLHARLTAGGAAASGDLVGTAGGASALTLPAAAIGAVSAELAGVGEGLDASAAYRFEWGTTTSYGGVAAALSADEGGHVATRLTGLLPATTYHYRLVATAPGVRATGADQAFTTAPSGPSVGAAAALGTTANGATATGSAVTAGVAASAWFEYGTTAALGRTTTAVALGGDTLPRSVTRELTGLAADTGYFLRLVVRSGTTTRAGATTTFRTRPAIALARTAPPVDVAGTGAVLGGWVDPDVADATWWFDYGTDPARLDRSTPARTLAGGGADTWVEAAVADLAPGTTYHVRLRTAGDAGELWTFTTDGAGPSLRDDGAVAVAGTSAELGGRIHGNGLPATVVVRYGPTGTEHETAPVAIAPQARFAPYAIRLTGLAPDTEYRARVVATTAAGTATGEELVLRTDPPGPSIQAVVVGRSSATTVELEAVVNPNGAPATVTVAYGTGDPLDQATAAVQVAAGEDEVSLPLVVTGLAAGTAYRLHVVATSDAGSATSSDEDVETGPAGPALAIERPASVGGTTARLEAIAAPDGAGTVLWFEYGATTAYGARTAEQPVAGPFAAYAAQLTDLPPSSDVHWRAVARSATGQRASTDQVLRTDAAGPRVRTLAASVDATGAVLGGSAVANREAATGWFEYGLDTAYGATTTEQDAGAGLDEVPLAARIGGLRPNSIYHVRARARNASGLAAGADVTFTTPPSAPALEVAAARDVTRRAATVAGSATAYGEAATCWFEHGTTTAYGQRSAPVPCGAGYVAMPAAATLTGLAPGTTYHWRLVAANATGTARSADQQLATLDVAPARVVATSVAAGSPTTLVVAATVDPGGLETALRLEWQTATGAVASRALPALAAADAPVALGATIADLVPDTAYRVRLVATNARGGETGAESAGRTSPLPPPGVVPRAATGIGRTGATLPFALAGNGLATTWRVEYGTAGYDRATAPVAAGTGASEPSATLAGLAPGTAYRWRVVATSSSGTTVAEGATFTTEALPRPTISGLATSATGLAGTTVGATIDPAETTTTWHVEVGRTTEYGTSTPSETLPAGAAAPVAVALTGLEPATVYHVRVVAVNAGGTTASSDLAVTTLAHPAPTVSATALASSTATGARLTGRVDSPIAAVAWLEVGTTTAYGTATAGIAADGPVALEVGGLLPGTAYHARVVARSASGTTAGPDIAFTTPATAPTALAAAASAIGADAATIDLRAATGGAATTAVVEWGTTTGYGATSAALVLPASPLAATGSIRLVGLAPDTAYHARVVLESAVGTARSADVALRTLPRAPGAVSGAGSADGQTAIAVAGTVAPNGAATSWWIEYGTDAALGARTTPVTLPADAEATAVSARLAGLAAATAIRWRLVAASAGGTTTGATQETSTLPWPAPALDADATVATTITTARVSVRVAASQLDTWVNVELGTDASYGRLATPRLVPAAATATTLAFDLAGLAPGTAYRWRGIATNATGTTRSGGATLTTRPGLAPTVTGAVAGGIGRNGATLAASVAANELATTARVEWGTSAAYGSASDPIAITGSQGISAAAAGLAPGATYHWRIVATNAVGSTATPDATFTTAPAVAPGLGAVAVLGVLQDRATVTGSVTTGGAAAQVRVEYGPTSAYGSTTAAVAVAADGPYAVEFGGLAAATGYHLRVIAEGPGGTTRSPDAVLTTASPPPAPTPPPAPAPAPSGLEVATAAVQPDGASLDAVADTGGVAATAWIEYGTDGSFGASGPRASLAASDGPQRVRLVIGGLAAATGYRYRLVVANASGTSRSAAVALATPPWPLPVAATLPADGIEMRAAVLHGEVTTVGIPAEARVEYGIGTALDRAAPAVAIAPGAGAQPVRAALADLEPDTAYAFRVVATSASGRTVSATGSFRTRPLTVPTVGAASATVSGPTAATAAGSVAANGLPTTAWIEYGTDGALDRRTPAQRLAAGASVRVAARLEGLAPGTTYAIRLVAESEGGRVVGRTGSLETPELLAPVAETGGATAIGAGTATVRALVAPNRRAATWWFEYGTSTAYGRRTPAIRLAASGGRQPVRAVLAGLAAATTYHLRVVARSDAGTTYGDDATFATAEPRADDDAPVARIERPACGDRAADACARFRSGVGAWATLRGSVLDAGAASSGVAAVSINAWRRLAAGRCQAYDGQTWQPMPCADADDVWVPATLAGDAWRAPLRDLGAGTYTFRVRGVDRAGNVQTRLVAGAASLTARLRV